MKKIIVGLVVLIIIILIWFGESRKFYCLGENKCVTVWKTYNNTCYIVPGKYYGIIKPPDNYVKTTNTNHITLYWSAQISGSIIVRAEKDFVIFNKNKSILKILNYNDEKSLEEILYGSSSKFFDLKGNANLINIDIKENYARGKGGKRL